VAGWFKEGKYLGEEKPADFDAEEQENPGEASAEYDQAPADDGKAPANDGQAPT